jgi:hypothetical protein
MIHSKPYYVLDYGFATGMLNSVGYRCLFSHLYAVEQARERQYEPWYGDVSLGLCKDIPIQKIDNVRINQYN